MSKNGFSSTNPNASLNLTNPNSVLNLVGLEVFLAPADKTVRKKHKFKDTCRDTPFVYRYITTHYNGPFWLNNISTHLQKFASGLFGIHQRYLKVNATSETKIGEITRESRCGTQHQTNTVKSKLETQSITSDPTPSFKAEYAMPQLDTLKDSAFAVVQQLKHLCTIAIENAKIYDAKWLKLVAAELNETVIPTLAEKLAIFGNKTADLKEQIIPEKAKKDKANTAYKDGLDFYLPLLFFVPIAIFAVFYGFGYFLTQDKSPLNLQVEGNVYQTF